jgi:hypothetical protein
MSASDIRIYRIFTIGVILLLNWRLWILNVNRSIAQTSLRIVDSAVYSACRLAA